MDPIRIQTYIPHYHIRPTNKNHKPFHQQNHIPTNCPQSCHIQQKPKTLKYRYLTTPTSHINSNPNQPKQIES